MCLHYTQSIHISDVSRRKTLPSHVHFVCSNGVTKRYSSETPPCKKRWCYGSLTGYSILFWCLKSGVRVQHPPPHPKKGSLAHSSPNQTNTTTISTPMPQSSRLEPLPLYLRSTFSTETNSSHENPYPNYPVYSEYQTRSAKVMTLLWKRAHQEIPHNNPSVSFEFSLACRLRLYLVYPNV